MKYLLLLLLTSLAQASIDPAIQPYVNSFIATGHDYGAYYEVGKLRAEFDEAMDGEYNTIGMCRTYFDEGNLITLRKSWWQEQNDTQRMLLVYHELGHCLLYRGHTAELRKGYPLSLMHPTILTPRIFRKRSMEYLREMFDGTDRLMHTMEVRQHTCEATK